jgi:hypothetical protein
LIFASSLLLLVACSKGSSGGPAPAKPNTGAPVAFETVSVSKDALELRGYNFSDKPLVNFQVLIRYKDANGNVLRVKLGTPFESDFDHWSFSGLAYKEKPGEWTKVKLDHLTVPSGAAKAEVLLEAAYALKSDGLSVEQTPTFRMPYATKWPG